MTDQTRPDVGAAGDPDVGAADDPGAGSGPLGGLSLADKAALTCGADFWHSRSIDHAGIPALLLTDGPHGVRKQAGDADSTDLSHSVPATCFPTAAALASSWDRQLVREVGAALGAEARAEQVAVLLGPGMNIKRSPLCGRNFEYFAEDPLLTGELAAAFVLGVQSQGVAASVKHLALNNQETDRMRMSADVDERTMREIYLAAFERVVRTAEPWTVMCSYNKINGVYAARHRQLLTEILRDEWGFDGLVMSDWGAVDQRVPCLAAGLDLQMPGPDPGGDDAVVAAVESGELNQDVLDRAAGRLLRLHERVGPAMAEPASYDPHAHHALARRAAADGSVLLTNNGVLPLRPAAGQVIAVLGEFARTPRYQGAGSSLVTPTGLDDALTALGAGLPAGVRLAFAPGFRLDPPTGGDTVAPGIDRDPHAEAVAAAAAADVALLFLGLPPSAETEGLDRTTLDLPANQIALLTAVAQANPRTVVVLANGAVVTTSGWCDRAAAVLECWLGGQAGGSAVADVLLGRTDPGGRLAETIPVRLSDTPAYLTWPGEEGRTRYGEGVFVGYRHYDTTGRAVAFPFGHGLSYTEFAYSGLEVTVRPDGGLRVAVVVANVGARTGREVVQVYAHDVHAGVARPERELVGFAKITLPAGDRARVVVDVEPVDLSFWSSLLHRWVLEAGEFDVSVGASARDLRLTTRVDVPGETLSPPLTSEATIAEWLADPVGGPRLRAALGAGAAGQPIPGPLGDPHLRPLVEGTPLGRAPALRLGLTDKALAELLAADGD